MDRILKVKKCVTSTCMSTGRVPRAPGTMDFTGDNYSNCIPREFNDSGALMHDISTPSTTPGEETITSVDFPLPCDHGKMNAPTGVVETQKHSCTVETLNIDTNTGSGETAYHNWGIYDLVQACKAGFVNVVISKLEGGAQVNQAESDGRTPLIVACREGHLDVVRVLLKFGAQVDMPDQEGVTGIWFASQNGYNDIVRLLLQNGATVNIPRYTGRTALIQACQEGHLAVVRVLLESAAEVGAADLEGVSSLWIASQQGHTDIVQALLDHKANVNVIDNDGRTPLIQASQNGHTGPVVTLLSHGAKVNIADEKGSTALLLASRNGHCDIVSLLLQHGANVNLSLNYGTTPLLQASKNGHTGIVRILLENEADPDASDHKAVTPLWIASEYGHADIVRCLLDSHAQVNLQSYYGRTALIQASQNGYPDIAKLLLETGADAEITDEEGTTCVLIASEMGHSDIIRQLLPSGTVVNSPRLDGRTPIMQASQSGHTEVVKLLLESGAKVDAVSEEGITGLLVASENGHMDTVRLLLEMGATVDHPDHEGTTALLRACQEGYTFIARVLIDHGANVDAVDHRGNTSLMRASNNGHCDTVNLLLEIGADVNKQEEHTDGTGLLLASKKGHDAVVKQLLEKGANVNIASHNGRTALIEACQHDRIEIVKMLLEYGAGINTGDQKGVTGLLIACDAGRIDICRVLLENGANVNLCSGAALSENDESEDMDVMRYEGVNVSCLWIASQNGNLDIVKLLLENGAEVNITNHNDRTALIKASQDGHTDTVQLLIQFGAAVDLADEHSVTALLAASSEGHWETAKVLLEAGADIRHTNRNGESAAMYLAYAEVCGMLPGFNIPAIIHRIPADDIFQQCEYSMSLVSFILTGLVSHNRPLPQHFHALFTRMPPYHNLDDCLYGFLPEVLHHGVNLCTEIIYPPYRGIEGRISLHTLRSAMLCKLPVLTLQHAGVQQSSVERNMFFQTPLHLLALETHFVPDMEARIMYMTKTLGISLSWPDSNGRVPYHLACMSLNAQFLLCSLKLDAEVCANMMIEDHIVMTPLSYMLRVEPTALGVQTLHALSGHQSKRLLQVLIGERSVPQGKQVEMSTHGTPNTPMSLQKMYRPHMRPTQLSALAGHFRGTFLSDKDILALFQDCQTGLVELSRNSYVDQIVGLLELLHTVGREMGKMDPLFECLPELKGSIQEYTKCGTLDEVDISMKLVNFGNVFDIHLQNGRDHMIFAEISSMEKRYLKAGKNDKTQFSSIEFCAHYWLIFMKALATTAVTQCLVNSGFTVEHCKRKHGFVGMLELSCKIDGHLQLMSVDLVPCVDSERLDGYIALLRPRHYDNQIVGDEFYKGFELSSSQKDWGLLKSVPVEVLYGYTLVKLLRSQAKSFQAEDQRVYTPEAILPSYLLKTALLWILDPDDKFSTIYGALDNNIAFLTEMAGSYHGDVLRLCRDLLKHMPWDDEHISHTGGQVPAVHNLAEGMARREDHSERVQNWPQDDADSLREILEQCIASPGYLSGRDRTRPYVLAGRCRDLATPNGLVLPQMMGRNCTDELLSGASMTKDEQVCSESIHFHHSAGNPMGNRYRITDDIEYTSSDRPKELPSEMDVESARKSRVWALRILRVIPPLLQYKKGHVRGLVNYYLPEQEVYPGHIKMAVDLCEALKALLDG